MLHAARRVNAGVYCPWLLNMRMLGLNKLFLISAAIFVAQGIGVSSEAKSKNYAHTRKLLTQMDTFNTGSGSRALANLFKVGDKRISDLITALDDKDKDVSLHAQLVIRYLGNEIGMKELRSRYKSGKENREAGPIPIPLSDSDYSFINNFYLGRGSNTWHIREYMYALALDSSPEATKIFARLRDKYELPGDTSIDIINEPLDADKEIAKVVLENAFFISQEDRKYTISHLLAFNEAQDKALIEVYVNRGALAEEWHHVVISRSGKGWKFFSVTMVAQS
jgi:hypothetical protein